MMRPERQIVGLEHPEAMARYRSKETEPAKPSNGKNRKNTHHHHCFCSEPFHRAAGSRR
ncbi:hypothetical protein AGR3A_Cc260042 [Agrobacterium tomkonis CFBP 6623]|uniref:Uncharacterized protein n=1 Tax=Agrobacterium tomkonis CFBP 6623 TaxID=1183432 RepID=A0A1S7PGZ5_9HYPH|nr:hypothetical protein AGR3A_Cc260042 [Agrobacterium tomkonis CFBP 6623]